MAKAPTLPTITGSYASSTQLNAAFRAIEDSFENTLSLDGSTPNSMDADLDMNSQDILNAGTVNADDVVIDGESVLTLLSGAVASGINADRAEAAATEAALYDGPKVDTFSQLATVTPAMLNVGGLIRVIETGAVYQRVSSGGDLDYSGAGGVRLNVLPETLAAPYLEQTTKALQMLPWSVRADVLSGAPTLDHTAALAAIWSDSGVKRAVEFPSNGVFSVSSVQLPVGTVAREFIFGGSKFKQRADRTSGGQFLRLMQPTSIGAYGSWDDITIEGGVFDLDGKVQWSAIAWLPYMRRATIRDLTVVHRSIVQTAVTLDAATDTFTAAAHPYQNGDGVVVFSGQNSVPGGHPGSGTRFFVINRTANTFQLSLTSGGAAFNFTSAGAGVLVQLYVNWGMVVGGRDVQVINPRVLNGSGLYQDGLHIIHGAGIGVFGGYVESGDDALALGFEIDPAIPDLEIRDVSVSGLRVKAAMATAVKVYTPSGSGRTVVGAELEVIGESGMFRNGGVAFDGNYGTPLVDGFAPIRDIRVRANLTVGSVGRTQLNQPFIAKFTGCTNCHVDGQFRILGDDTLSWDEIYAERALDCSLTGEITKRDAQMDSTIDGATTRNVVSSIPPVYVAPVAPVVVTNLLANPWGSGGTPSAVPTGWRPSSGNNGLTMSFLYSEPDDDGFRKVGYRIVGTTSATSTAILCPNANSTVAHDPAKPKVNFECGVQIEGGSLPAGSTLVLTAVGLGSDGNTIIENTDTSLISSVSRTLQRFSALETVSSGSVQFIRGQVAYTIPTGQTVDLTIWLQKPVLSASA